MAVGALLPILIGYVLGSIPFGYVIVKLIRGIDVRDHGSRSIGATNVLRVAGWFPALLTVIGDIGKGAVPPLLATLPVLTGGTGNHWLVVAAAFAAILGHAYSGFFYLTERKFAKGKAVAAGAGAVLGFVIAQAVPWQALVIPMAVWAGALVVPKPIQGRWGWVSLASILGAISLPIACGGFGAPLPYILFGVVAALFVTWKHKDNIGRLLDGVEPRLGEKPRPAGIDRDGMAAASLAPP